ncbi:MAG: LytTR family DNA-binding domain-containing protein [Bacteroidota bacterium]
MNVVIVEDEDLAAERLEQLIKLYDPDINVLYTIDTVQDAVPFLRSHENDIDIVFLDIQLSDGTSFEIFNKIDYTKPVIFTTAYDQYSLQAFKVNSIDYLLKPIKYEELEAALNKHKRIINSGGQVPSFDISEIKNILKQVQQPYKQRFIVKFGNRIQYKAAEDIAYIVADGKIVHIVLKGNSRQYIIDHTLDELEGQLLDPSQFYRINRKFIIKIDAINDICNYAGNRLQVVLNTASDQELIVSRERVSDFKDWLNQ